MSSKAGEIYVEISLKDTGLKAGLAEAAAAVKQAEQSFSGSGNSIRESFGRISETVRSAGERMRHVGEQMIDTGENLGQALSLPFLAIGAAAVASAQKTQQGAAQWKQFTANIQEIQKALAPLGATLLKVANQYLPTLIKWVQQAVQWFTHLSPTTQKVLIGIGALAIALPPLIMFFGALMMSLGGLAPAFGAVASAISFLVSPVGLIIAGIVALGAALVWAYNHVSWFRNMVNQAWNGIKAVAIPVWNQILYWVRYAAGYILQLWYTYGPQITAAVRTAWHFVGGIIRQVLTAVWNFVASVVSKIKAFWQQNGSTIKQATHNVWNGIKSVIHTVVNIIKSIIKATWPVIKAVIVTAWDVIKTATKIAWNAIKTVINVALDIIMGWIKFFAKLLTGDWKGAFKSLWETTKSVFKQVWSFIKDTLGELASKAVQWGKNLINGFIDGIKSMFGDLKGVVKEGMNIVADFLGFHSPTKQGPGRESDEWAPNFMGMFAEGIKAGIPNVRAAVMDVAATVNPVAAISGPPVRAGNTYNIHVNGSNVRMDERALLRMMREVEMLYG